jgi:hypothetical protein
MSWPSRSPEFIPMHLLCDCAKVAPTEMLNKLTNKIIQVTTDTAADMLLRRAESEGIPYVGHLSNCSSA